MGRPGVTRGGTPPTPSPVEVGPGNQEIKEIKSDHPERYPADFVETWTAAFVLGGHLSRLRFEHQMAPRVNNAPAICDHVKETHRQRSHE
ncbi:hypothetical protein THAOC_25944 [Thalassiosira oceanica]|uniref:Uncharacterized protein n=1 Tax=Thalassiosira oceanica TaxID=159749 RepID=K0RQ11_THAOC|nr:hypothetical protein THAOC_25944 [Thalassiosira oceanica]|eukprot:EJK54429.1 hypothetical protein THAOC_25944 [Thalassiosira oceanica]